jgi:hypothetical protein
MSAEKCMLVLLYLKFVFVILEVVLNCHETMILLRMCVLQTLF